MNNVEILLVRACKSLEPTKRLHSVYRRFYFSSVDSKFDWGSKATILINLVTKYYPIPSIYLADYLNPDKAQYFVNDVNNYTYFEHLVGVLVSHIRLASISNFEGYKIPTRFKNKVDNHY